MKIFFLDRNIISIIKKFNFLEKNEINKFQTKCIRYSYILQNVTFSGAEILIINRLLKEDKISNLFSVMTSSIEGGYGRDYDREEYLSSVLMDGGTIRSFFRNARCDEKILHTLHNTHEDSKVENKEKHIKKYEDFLEEIAEYARVGTGDFLSKKAKIFQKALEFDIPKFHIIVICCLSAACGCQYSKNLLKRKKRRSSNEESQYYNNINDIMIPSRIGQFMALDENQKFEFITADQSLNNFVRLCPVIFRKAHSGPEDTVVTIKFAPNKGLFPNIEYNDFLSLFAE